MIQDITATTTNPLVQPNGSGESAVVRSDSAADTMNLTIHGTVAGVYTSETHALTGQTERYFTDFWDSFLHVLLASVATGTVTVHGQGTSGSAAFRGETLMVDGTTLTYGLTGAETVYRFKNVLATAYDVLIGADVTATMLNLKKAINNDGAPGTDYGTATVAHPTTSAAVSGTIITLTDLIPCERQLTWNFVQSSTHFSLPATLSGGVDGTLLATLTPGVTQAFNTVDLTNEDLSAANLIAGFSFVSDWFAAGGNRVTLYLALTSTPARTPTYETSTDGVTARAGLTSLPALSAGTVNVVNLSENAIEYWRYKIDNSAGTGARNHHARAAQG